MDRTGLGRVASGRFGVERYLAQGAPRTSGELQVWGRALYTAGAHASLEGPSHTCVFSTGRHPWPPAPEASRQTPPLMLSPTPRDQASWVQTGGHCRTPSTHTDRAGWGLLPPPAPSKTVTNTPKFFVQNRGGERGEGLLLGTAGGSRCVGVTARTAGLAGQEEGLPQPSPGQAEVTSVQLGSAGLG